MRLHRTVAAAVMLILLTSCGAYIVHPGAVSVAESKTYDLVNDANSIINISRAQFASGVLPDRLKPAFNKLVDAYNVAYPALQAYHDAVTKGLPADAKLTQLNAAKATLDASLAAFKGAK